jgi:uncharacterized membrane protein
MPDHTPHQRLVSIDALRGIVMVLMALDHVRDFFGPTPFPPTALANPDVTGPLFLTRWITHFCAPVFVFLAGTSAFLWWSRRRDGGRTSRRELSIFLLTRGVWLIAIEFLVVSPSWFLAVYLDPNVGFQGYFPIAQVIWAIGISMIVMSAVVWLPLWGVALFGAALVGGHNLLDGPLSGLVEHERFLGAPTDWFGKLVSVLHWSSSYFWIDGQPVVVIYPIIPWPGVMALGFAFGALMRWPERMRTTACLTIGASCVVLMVLLRATGGYGEPGGRAEFDTAGRSALSFVNLTKYPPSLQFLLMTLGPAIASIPLLERISSVRFGRSALAPLVTYGRVPFFYYLLHVPLINLASIVMARARGWSDAWWFAVSTGSGPAEYELNLGLVYAVWVGVVAALFPACWWFARFRSRHRWWWLRYL